MSEATTYSDETVAENLVDTLIEAWVTETAQELSGLTNHAVLPIRAILQDRLRSECGILPVVPEDLERVSTALAEAGEVELAEMVDGWVKGASTGIFNAMKAKLEAIAEDIYSYFGSIEQGAMQGDHKQRSDVIQGIVDIHIRHLLGKQE